MIKEIPPDPRLDVAHAAQVKVASSGLRGRDLNDLLRRSTHALADAVRKMAFAPGEVPVHLVAMSAHEVAGPNRNFDTWLAADLRKDHPTFVKKARYFRDHNNRDDDPFYGLVKLSHFNEELQRVELIVGLFSTKKAAERHGPRARVADKELEKLASGGDYGVSMSTRLPFDVCSSCGHEARTRAEYCTGATCKYGGLRDNIGRVFEDGHRLCAINPNNTFFDISSVWRPADRTAYASGVITLG